MSRYSDPQYVIGNTSHGMLRRIAHRLLNGPNSGKDRKVVEEYNKLEEDIRLGIVRGELDTGHENQRNEMQGDDVGNDIVYPIYELGDTTPRRPTSPISGLSAPPRGQPDEETSPISGLSAPPRGQPDEDISHDDRLAGYLQAQTDRMRKEEDFARATTDSSQISKALPPESTAIMVPTTVLDSSLQLSPQKSQESNAASSAYSVPVDSSPESSRFMITTQRYRRSSSHDEHSDVYSESSSYSLLDNYTSEEEPLILIGPNPQLATSQRSPNLSRSNPFVDSYTKYPDHPAFRLTPPVPLKDIPEKAAPTSQVSIPETFSNDQDMDGKGPGMEIELKPGVEEPKLHKQGPRIGQTEGNYF